MAGRYILEGSIVRRRHWVEEVSSLSGSFEADAAKVEGKLELEFAQDGEQCLLDHLRLCGSIPEKYDQDSSEEKLYSKHTDALLALTFRQIGF